MSDIGSREKAKVFTGGRRKGLRFHWWYILLILLVLAIIGTLAGYFYVNSKIHQDVAYVSGWNQVSSSSQPQQKQKADSELSKLDAGDFSAGDRQNYPIIKVKQKDPDVQNILIMGIDAGLGGDDGGPGDENHRADAMIVASLNSKTNTLKLASLLRDTKTYFPNTGTNHKLNAAFSYGGPGLQIDVINYAYQLDIQQYVQVDFTGFTDIINKVGSIPMQLTAAEATSIGIGSTAGDYTLNASQALAYARTREIDTDFMRTQRQRNVIFAVLKKFQHASMVEKAAALNSCLDDIKTNIPTTDVMGKLLRFTGKMSPDVPQITIPTEDDGMYTTETSPIWFWDIDWSKEVPRLQKFLYS